MFYRLNCTSFPEIPALLLQLLPFPLRHMHGLFMTAGQSGTHFYFEYELALS